VRENAREKDKRYVGEGRLLVEHGDTIRARCRGGGKVYELGLERGEWFCDCPALTTCSHLHALWLVTVEGGSRA
jgi:hypothetical protein